MLFDKYPPSPALNADGAHRKVKRIYEKPWKIAD